MAKRIPNRERDNKYGLTMVDRLKKMEEIT